jgi:hypothetical protein
VPVYERRCERCGQVFYARRPEARFHSDACRVAWHTARKEAERGAELEALRARVASLDGWRPDPVDRFMAEAAKIRRRRPARRSGAPLA